MTRLTEREYQDFVSRGRHAQKAMDAALEKDFLQQVKDLARMFGWKTYHTLRSKGSDPGFPDLVMARRGRVARGRGTFVSLIVAELKREGEDPTAEQIEWLNFFNEIGVASYVWRPSHWKEIQRVLR